MIYSLLLILILMLMLILILMLVLILVLILVLLLRQNTVNMKKFCQNDLIVNLLFYIISFPFLFLLLFLLLFLILFLRLTLDCLWGVLLLLFLLHNLDNCLFLIVYILTLLTYQFLNYKFLLMRCNQLLD